MLRLSDRDLELLLERMIFAGQSAEQIVLVGKLKAEQARRAQVATRQGLRGAVRTRSLQQERLKEIGRRIAKRLEGRA